MGVWQSGRGRIGSGFLVVVGSRSAWPLSQARRMTSLSPLPLELWRALPLELWRAVIAHLRPRRRDVLTLCTTCRELASILDQPFLEALRYGWKTNTRIRKAMAEFKAESSDFNSPQAEDKWGRMADWDVSEVTTMSR